MSLKCLDNSALCLRKHVRGVQILHNDQLLRLLFGLVFICNIFVDTVNFPHYG